MVIGDRLKEQREAKELSQGDIEKRTGLLRPYISRVENGHTVPSVETIEKLARAQKCQRTSLSTHGEAAASVRSRKFPTSADEWETTGATADYFTKLRRLLAKMGLNNESFCCTWPKKSPDASPKPFHLAVLSRVAARVGP
jgi:transcriptional regulator with XRE-family HTH domain